MKLRSWLMVPRCIRANRSPGASNGIRGSRSTARPTTRQIQVQVLCLSRIVFRFDSLAFERTKKGQELIFPEIEVDTYWCSVQQLTAQEVIELYHDHGTSEQFHSEIKSDMDLERLPSGSFTSNSLVLQLGMLTYNMLRIIGQQSLEEAELSQMPGSRSKKVSRRRIRTVMQDLIYMAGRLIHTGRRWFISFGQLNPFAQLWERIDKRLRSPATVLR